MISLPKSDYETEQGKLYLFTHTSLSSNEIAHVLYTVGNCIADGRKPAENIAEDLKKLVGENVKKYKIGKHATIKTKEKRYEIEITKYDEFGELPMFYNESSIQTYYFDSKELAKRETRAFYELRNADVIPTPKMILFLLDDYKVMNIVVREYVPGKTLESELRVLKKTPLENRENLLRDEINKALNVVKKLHSYGSSHNDMNVTNIIFNGMNGRVVDLETTSHLTNNPSNIQLDYQPAELDIGKIVLDISRVAILNGVPKIAIKKVLKEVIDNCENKMLLRKSMIANLNHYLGASNEMDRSQRFEAGYTVYEGLKSVYKICEELF
jgi:serine/threonine protein kinase